MRSISILQEIGQLADQSARQLADRPTGRPAVLLILTDSRVVSMLITVEMDVEVSNSSR